MFTIVVSNTGAGTAYSVSVSDPLPASGPLTWTTSTPGATISGGILTDSLGNIGSGGSDTIAVSATTPTGYSGSLPNTATAISTNNSPGSVTASATDTVLNPIATPTLITTASFKAGTGNVVGTAIPEDSAVLSNGTSETGAITFKLTAPNGSVVDTQTITASGNKTYTTTNTSVATQVGTYTWSVSFAGDSSISNT